MLWPWTRSRTSRTSGDLDDGNIGRINGMGGDPRHQSVDIIAQTQAQKVEVVGDSAVDVQAGRWSRNRVVIPDYRLRSVE
jgi:hypothetical protein